MQTKKLEAIEISKKGRKSISGLKDLENEIASKLHEATTTILESIIYGGIELQASDIHFEITKNGALLRFRIDGVLHDVYSFPIEIYDKLLSRIKLVSKMKLNVEQEPQDGRFTILFKGDGEEATKIEIRSATLPSENGESIVMRILNPKNLKDISELGIRSDLMEIFERAIKNPTGLIITTGPTGSGKTTTLYAFLKKIKSPEIKIITIEDPIEYHLEGVTQTQVSNHYSFAEGLKSIMRQDPDVILVGEIRDEETAQIAVQAALTGHKVFSTVHANEAVGVIPRLKTMGVKSSNLGPALNMSIAQRLLRKLCPSCAQKIEVSEETKKKILEAIKNLPESVNLPDLSGKVELLKEKGCEKCNFTGFKGRVGIFEAFLVDDRIKEMIISGASEIDIEKELIKNGMTTLKQDAIIKMLNKITSLSEVERVVGMI